MEESTMKPLHNNIDPESQIITILEQQAQKTNILNYTSTTKTVKIDTQPLLALLQQPETTVKTVWYNILKNILEPDYTLGKQAYERIWSQ